MVVDLYNVWSTMSLNADPDNAEDRLTKNKLAAALMYRYIRLIMPVRHYLRHLNLRFPILDAPAAFEAPLPGHLALEARQHAQASHTVRCTYQVTIPVRPAY